MNEESELSKLFPEKFRHGSFKILDWNWFNSKRCVGAVLVWDLVDGRLKGFIGSPKDQGSEESDVRQIADWRCSLPTSMVVVIFKNYLSQENVINLLHKELKLFINMLEILHEK